MITIKENINGFVKINRKNIPFEFDKTSFQLKIYESFDEWSKEVDYRVIIDRIFADNKPNETKEIEYINLEGMTSDRRFISFKVVNIPTNKNGFKVYPCLWLYVDTADNTKNISGVRISGETLDYYSPSYKVFSTMLKPSKKQCGYEEFVVKAKSSKKESSGRMSNCKFSIQSNATLKSKNSNPLSSSTKLLLSFDQVLDIDSVETFCLNVYQVFQFLSYRRNIVINDFEILVKNKDGELSSSGVLSIHLKQYELEANKNLTFILNHETIGNKFAKLVEMYSVGTIPIAYIPNSFFERNSYELSRIYLILADFEYQFKKLYHLGNSSKTLKQSKKRIIKLIKKEIESEIDDSIKTDLLNIQNCVNNINNSISYFSSLKYAFDKNKAILQPFIKKYYKGDYYDVTNEIASCIRDVRNEFSHGSLSVDVSQQILKNIGMIERLNYSMVLKRAGIKEDQIIKGINGLYNDMLNIN